MKRLCIHIRRTQAPPSLIDALHALLTTQTVRGVMLPHRDGIDLDLEGSLDDLPKLVGMIQETVLHAEPSAQVDGHALPWFGYNEFATRKQGTSYSFGNLPVDRPLCALCEQEVLDPLNRRENYALAFCPRCGPRFTALAGPETNRDAGVLGRYLMCLDCERETALEGHPRAGFVWNSCPECGPQAVLVDPSGKLAAGDPVDEAAWALREGRVVAIKGPGGYALSCDATNPQAVARLRKAKQRKEQPLPVMVRDLDQAEAWAVLSDKERYWLTSGVGPIVPARTKTNALRESIHPGLDRIGLCLPPSALHLLLLEAFDMPPLVLASAHLPGEWPIISDYEVVRQFAKHVDLFLMHTQPIVVPMPKSVVCVSPDGDLWLNRGFGVVPQAVELQGTLLEDTLAMGGMKDYAFALGRGGKAVLSPSYGAFYKESMVPVAEENLGHFLHTHGFSPRRTVTETLSGRMYARLLEKIDHDEPEALPHTAAHAAALAADAPCTQPMVVAVLDQGATLNGQDRGDADFFLCDPPNVLPLGRLQAFPEMEAPADDCWKRALVTLDAVWPDGEWLGLPIWNRVEETTKEITLSVSRHDHGGKSTSPLRLLETLAVLCDLRGRSSYPRQCVLEIDALADVAEAHPYPLELHSGNEGLIVGLEPFLRGVVADLLARVAVPVVLGNALATVAEMIVLVAQKAAPQARHVGLTGEVFVAERLRALCIKRIREVGKIPVIHRHVPCTDQNLALGQLQWAAWNPKNPAR